MRVRVRVCAWCVRCVALISGCGLAFCCVILKIGFLVFVTADPNRKVTQGAGGGGGADPGFMI